MKIKAIHRITALTLAFLMFFTSIGFSIDFHYCKDELKSFSLIGKAASCHTALKTCPHHPAMKIMDNEKKDCCTNKKMKVDDLDKDYNFSSDVNLNDLQLKFVAAFAFSFSIISLPSVVKSIFPKSEILAPPLDIYVLLERFLI